jgi:hypothetical protein
MLREYDKYIFWGFGSQEELEIVQGKENQFKEIITKIITELRLM